MIVEPIEIKDSYAIVSRTSRASVSISMRKPLRSTR
jgi:hypothetical protein